MNREVGPRSVAGSEEKPICCGGYQLFGDSSAGALSKANWESLLYE